MHPTSRAGRPRRRGTCPPPRGSRRGPRTTRTRASLPTVVVLPVPLTPTTRMTAGRPSMRDEAIRRSISGSTRASRSALSQALTSASLVAPDPSTLTLVRSRSTSSFVASTPRSARIRVSSTSSHASSSRPPRESRTSSALPMAVLLRASRARRRARRPRAEAGRSRVGSSSMRMSSSTSGSAGRVGAGRVSTLPPSASLSRSVGGAVGDEGLGGGGGGVSSFWRDDRPRTSPTTPATRTMATMAQTATISQTWSNTAPILARSAGPPGRPFVL